MARIIIDPVTRIVGFLEINARAENNVIVEADASGLMYRGFETMLLGRSPLDATYFTERICGICSTAHATASTLALENALIVEVPVNDQYLRDIMHGLEFIQNHLRHFYLLVLPSYVKIKGTRLTEEVSYSDYRLPEAINQRLTQHYQESFEYSRLAHEGHALLGGKAPHTHGIFVGGVTTIINSYNLTKLQDIIQRIRGFVSDKMKEDTQIIAEYYADYYQKGISYPNFLSYGVFDRYTDPDITYLKAGVQINGRKYPFQPKLIKEQILHTWFTTEQGEIDKNKQDAYSYIKAPRYEGLAMEVGPLARLTLTGEYTKGHSCMDRIVARTLETEKILSIVENLLNRVELLTNNQKVISIPEEAIGAGMVDTTRGALGHFLQIKNKVIHHYNIITPTVWNLSPKDEENNPGVIEQALIGTAINNVNEPIEIGRIVRSFDPCIACATHFLGGNEEKTIEVLV